MLPAGDAAVLAELDDLDAVLALAAALRAEPLPGTVDVVPATRTVLVIFDGTTSAERVTAGLEAARLIFDGTTGAGPAADSADATVEVAVRYDGEDLADVARLTGLSPAEVIQRHTSAAYLVAFCGFAPGFAYLTGGDPALRVPRRSPPRTAVPAGSIALADTFTGTYPRRMPGGWQLIGHTDAVLWDLHRDPPALLPPGARVRFRAAT
jgi:KipI family sensor histidine kinase inhibitor